MGIFDNWRRKKLKAEAKSSKPSVKPRKPVKMTEDGKQDMDVLLAEHEKLTLRREELQSEREVLTKRLDGGELTALEFRKELMSRIQEASSVSDQLKDIAASLISMGYRGALH